MPALEEEIEEAVAEGIVINNSWAPKRIITENGRFAGVEFKRCLSVYDTNRRFSPVFDENDTITVKADYLLLSVGQSMVWGNLVSGTQSLSRQGNLMYLQGVILSQGRDLP
jgi:NADPH-dependent glutamate synthase beta subunit-like oxidoreductase